MTDRLPPHLLRLFAPRPPLPYVPPLDREPGKKRENNLTSLSQFLPLCKGHDPDYVATLTIAERKKKKMNEKKALYDERIKKGLEEWDPNADPNVGGDPYKTLFISRLNFQVTEKELRREFEMYGPIENIRVVRAKDEQSRGYAFIEYEREKDMKAAYKDADGIKILGRRVVVDVERGRTVKGWKPKRLGGGLGGTRIGAPHENQAASGRAQGGGSSSNSVSGGGTGSNSYERGGGGGRQFGDRDRGGRGGGGGGRFDRGGDRYGGGGAGGDRDRDRDRGRGYGDRNGDRNGGSSRGGYRDRSHERDSKRRRSRSRSRSPRGYGDYSRGRRDSRGY
ncbi:hypothetical protein DFQ27_001189 [Actinomortierella ambigua]|uniref:U1 small nuclear ribonucleoprotein 70 kDa n=1 Tax=Actinomortierella ambigua TaxID=1343610 RepID=A0A9P6QDX7_9FUNG|nr:hypothetical protein DFQ27_001189 [Actinomortierella ambigua]